jgi:hypothetical protein
MTLYKDIVQCSCTLHLLLGVTKLSEPPSADVNGILLLSTVVNIKHNHKEHRKQLFRLVDVSSKVLVAHGACNVLDVQNMHALPAPQQY